MTSIDPSEFKCPVCGSRDVEARNLIQESVLMTCKTCGTTDDARMFAPRHKLLAPSSRPAPQAEDEHSAALNDTETMRQYFPPDDVQEAARKVSDYFKARGAKTWAFGELQSRNWKEEASPTMSREAVQRLAAAFRMMVIPTDQMAELQDLVLQMEQAAIYLRANGSETHASNLDRFWKPMFAIVHGTNR